jgi:hypothetical protein
MGTAASSEMDLNAHSPEINYRPILRSRQHDAHGDIGGGRYGGPVTRSVAPDGSGIERLKGPRERAPGDNEENERR